MNCRSWFEVDCILVDWWGEFFVIILLLVIEVFFFIWYNFFKLFYIMSIYYFWGYKLYGKVMIFGNWDIVYFVCYKNVFFRRKCVVYRYWSFVCRVCNVMICFFKLDVLCGSFLNRRVIEFSVFNIKNYIRVLFKSRLLFFCEMCCVFCEVCFVFCKMSFFWFIFYMSII